MMGMATATAALYIRSSVPPAGTTRAALGMTSGSAMARERLAAHITVLYLAVMSCSYVCGCGADVLL
jgi:hypothetical protein